MGIGAGGAERQFVQIGYGQGNGAGIAKPLHHAGISTGNVASQCRTAAIMAHALNRDVGLDDQRQPVQRTAPDFSGLVKAFRHCEGYLLIELGDKIEARMRLKPGDSVFNRPGG